MEGHKKDMEQMHSKLMERIDSMEQVLQEQGKNSSMIFNDMKDLRSAFVEECRKHGVEQQSSTTVAASGKIITTIDNTFRDQLVRKIQDWLKKNIYRELKFLEKNHHHAIHNALMTLPQLKKPDGIADDVYDKLILCCTKKAFKNLRHNSQILVRRHYIGR